jgi:hypothetical protein
MLFPSDADMLILADITISGWFLRGCIQERRRETPRSGFTYSLDHQDHQYHAIFLDHEETKIKPNLQRHS